MNKSVRDIGLFVIGISSLYMGLNLFINNRINQKEAMKRRLNELVNVASDHISISMESISQDDFVALSTSCLPYSTDEAFYKFKKLNELPTKEEYSACLRNRIREYAQNKLVVFTNPDSQEYKRLVSLLDRLN